jgi:antitoxin component YwqK of YwqJK toxin-antitoxin module
MTIGGSYYAYYSDGDISSTSNYYHIVVTLDGTLLSYYINGVLDSTDTVASGTWASDNGQPDLLLGAQNEGTAANFSGEIPIVKLYNTALSVNEVKQNYNQYKTRFNLS